VVEGDDHCEAYTAIVWGRLLSRERYYAAEAEAVDIAEGNMCGPVMRGSIAQPWSKTLSRTKGTCRNLGDLNQRPRKALDFEIPASNFKPVLHRAG
jgi:hypothetical protein